VNDTQAAAATRDAKVLVVEDEQHLAQGIAENLEAEGAQVDVVHDGRSALERMIGDGYDLVILDVMLPELDGFTVCELARARGSEVPVLFLTAKGGVHDRIHGLEVGGDDYLAKPFHLQELLLRVRAILRRGRESIPSGPDVVEFGGNRFDFRAFSGRSWDGREQILTQKEAEILRLLAEREGEVVSRDEILDRVWGHEELPSTRTVDNFIVRLRKRFEPDTENPKFFHTVWGVGYKFTASGE
jgi:two-component system alkaline phosphatase synthesis response regulator PhoP